MAYDKVGKEHFKNIVVPFFCVGCDVKVFVFFKLFYVFVKFLKQGQKNEDYNSGMKDEIHRWKNNCYCIDCKTVFQIGNPNFL